MECVPRQLAAMLGVAGLHGKYRGRCQDGCSLTRA